MSNIRRNVTPHPAGSDHHDDGHMHFRLCHLCFHLNEADAEITQCLECQHLFKDEILTQFFDDQDQEAFTDAHPEDVRQDSEDEEAEKAKLLSDVNGLSVRF